MKIDESFMQNFRWITPIALGMLTLMTTILIQVVSNLTTEIRAVRMEVTETRRFAVQYTDKMIELILKTNEKKK